MKLQRFKIKDIVFLAIMAALLFVCSAVALPLMSISLFGLRNMATAPFYGVFVTLALMKVRKPGALTLLGFFNSIILLMMSPVMFVTNTVSALISELIALLIFKNYDSDKAVYTAAALMIPVTLPFTALFSVIMNGVSFAYVIGDSWFVILTCLGTVLLSILGTFIGSKIGKELRKAGKI
ncbi:MAG: MptD family putative ECF transporter S component [Christensenellales bacterium]|jgi:energy-coupling factor transport system substrate-specific component